MFDDYQVGDLAFYKGHLSFRDGKLYQIWLSLKDPFQCEKLITILQLTYGKPAKDEATHPTDSPPDHYVTWYDQKHNNQVDVIYRRYPAVLNLDDDCDLTPAAFEIALKSV